MYTHIYRTSDLGAFAIRARKSAFGMHTRVCECDRVDRVNDSDARIHDLVSRSIVFPGSPVYSTVETYSQIDTLNCPLYARQGTPLIIPSFTDCPARARYLFRRSGVHRPHGNR